jgi:transcriptional regulator with XRE-family HTH domain
MPKVINLSLQVSIGKRVTALREARNLSKNSVAKSLGLSFEQLHKYETGRNCPSVARIRDIAKLFDVHPCNICGCCEVTTGDLPKRSKGNINYAGPGEKDR